MAIILLQLNPLADIEKLPIGEAEVVGVANVVPEEAAKVIGKFAVDKVKLIAKSIHRILQHHGAEKTHGTAPPMAIERAVAKDLKQNK